MTKTFKGKSLFRFSNFGYWDLFDIWVLVFGISSNSTIFQTTTQKRICLKHI